MKFLRTVFVIVLIVLLAGCVKYTGGGWVVATDGEGKANFGFVVDSCDYDATGVITGQFNFHDKYWRIPVKMKGDILEAYDVFGFAEVYMSYTSTNPKFPGEGFASIQLYDGGEGSNAMFADWFVIYVWDGPFGGYYNSGEVQGNIQSHDCPEPDPE